MRFINEKSRKVLATICLVAVVIFFTQAPRNAAADNSHSNAKAKNIILMIADGAGFNTYLAADYYQYGHTGRQVYEKFPSRVAVSTYEYEWKTFTTDGLTPLSFELYGYDTNQFWSNFGYAMQTNPLNRPYINTSTDSASAATAMATGKKTKDGSIGFAFDETMNLVSVPNIVEFAEGTGRSTGVVTTVPFSHATPAGFVAHNESRDNYAAIANEMIYSSKVDVIMGCSAPDYGYNGEYTGPSSSKLKYVGGATTWADLNDADGALGADADGDGVPDAWTLIRDKGQFEALASGPTPNRVIGIPRVYQSLQYYRNPMYSPADAYVDPFIPGMPTLADMSKAALNVLDNTEKGFFLMIEGGAVDWASHFNQKGRMVEEQIDFNRAVEAVVDWVEKNSNWGETMVIVTADHETGYVWGPDSNPAFKPIINKGAGKMPILQYYGDIGGFNWHSNSLVPLYAKGDASRLFKSYAKKMDVVRGHYIDNTDIFKIVQSCFK
jgi:alkaline phosphatase